MKIFLLLFVFLPFFAWSEDVVVNPPTPPPAVTSADESQVVLNLDSNKKNTSTNSSASQILTGFALLSVMLGGAYYFVRKKAYKNGKNPHHNFKIISQHHLGPRKSLAVVHISGESMLIGITDHHISLIKSLSLIDDELEETVPPKKFNQVLNQSLGSDKTVTPVTKEDEFSIQGIKDMVSIKLKNMKDMNS